MKSKVSLAPKNEIEEMIEDVCLEMKDFLIEKNRSYGNSVFEPINIFSQLDSLSQIDVRLDDKLKRLARGYEHGNDDTIKDLLGYLILRKVFLKVAKAKVPPLTKEIFEE
jgi:uncharacterized protein (DUF2461 family)